MKTLWSWALSNAVFSPEILQPTGASSPSSPHVSLLPDHGGAWEVVLLVLLFLCSLKMALRAMGQ